MSTINEDAIETAESEAHEFNEAASNPPFRAPPPAADVPERKPNREVHAGQPAPAALVLENELQALGLTAPRVTPQMIEQAIVGEYYFRAGDAAELFSANVEFIPSDQLRTLNCLTFCVLVLRNGFTVTGESACASPENFNEEIGKRLARENAVRKIWPLEGYVLRQRLSQVSSGSSAASVSG